MAPIDPFTLAVIQASLIGVARDMKIMTMRTAYTQLWKEQGDLSCCIMDRAGEIVAQDPNGFPIHVTTMPLQLKGTLDAIGIENFDLATYWQRTTPTSVVRICPMY